MSTGFMSCQGVALLFYFLCRNVVLLHCYIQASVAAEIWILQQGRNGATERTLLCCDFSCPCDHAMLQCSSLSSPHMALRMCVCVCA